MTSFNFSAPPPRPPPPPLPPSISSAPFKPSIAVVVGVLTTMFSITLLMLLYAKHCKRGNGMVYYGFNADAPVSGRPRTSTGRKNSGIDRSVIESLPIFRFSSLRGQKDGLECSVCLTRFESSEVLRLLPKCKHAFHVECVDTWLDAHSTCPLCRYRVDPEDILLIDRDSLSGNIFHHNHIPLEKSSEMLDVETGRSEKQTETEANQETAGFNGYRRISGRHSWAGEKESASLSQIVVQRPTSGSERVPHQNTGLVSLARRSVDSFGLIRKTNNESVTVGCFDRYPSHQRKDGLLLINGEGNSDQCGSRKSAGPDKLRFEHRINIVSGSGIHQRWSDVQPSDLLYLRSEMIISDLASRPSVGRRQRIGEDVHGGEGERRSNGRSVSEITGLDRFSGDRDGGERQAGVVSRWLAWISSASQTDVRSIRTPL